MKWLKIELLIDFNINDIIIEISNLIIKFIVVNSILIVFLCIIKCFKFFIVLVICLINILKIKNIKILLIMLFI